MTYVAKAGRRGFTLFGRDPTGTIGIRHFPGMADVLARGSQTVVPPTPHPTGPPYRYTTSSTLLDTPIAALPIICPDIADKLAIVLGPWLERRLPPNVARLQLRSCELSQSERERQHRYAMAILAHELEALGAMISSSGRNQAAFRLVCRVGRWAHHGIIPRDGLTAEILAACERNGLVREDGRRAVLATIASGLTKSAGDSLPNLGGRP